MSQRTLPRLRLVCQVVCFALFLFLLVRTGYSGSFVAERGAVRLPYPVGLFLEADPLVAVANALSTHSWYRHLWWALVVLVPTFVLGRAFCGWVCPMGTIHHFAGSLKSEKKRGSRLIESNRYKGWQRTKYYILAVGLAAALCGSMVVGLIDPISLAVRSLALSVMPALSYAHGSVTDWLYGTGVRPLQWSADAIQAVGQATGASFRQPHFRQAALFGLILAFLIALNLRITRFWCRAICPLGALLGLASRWSILGLSKNPAACDTCNRCLLHCQGGDDPLPGPPWRKAECHLCFNCVSDCPSRALAFRFFPARDTRNGVEPLPQLQRRKLLTSLAAGVGVVPLLRSSTGLAVDYDARLIRPPGALAEPHFLDRCIRCGACMKVCPNNALHPTLAEGGLEALWTPVVVPRVGYCEPNCVLCSQVCPTGAIWELSEEEKLGRPAARHPDGTEIPAVEPVRIGTAFYDRGRCLPWAMATECIVCEEWCPTAPKAIYFVPADVVDSKGVTRTVRQPYVDPRLCIGCGACEYACPVRDRAAIAVTSVGESRSRSNQFLLQPPARRKQ